MKTYENSCGFGEGPLLVYSLSSFLHRNPVETNFAALRSSGSTVRQRQYVGAPGMFGTRDFVEK